MLKEVTVNNLDIIYTASCNMACKYCFIHKDAVAMKNNNDIIRQALQDGSFANNIIQKMKGQEEKLLQIALWGGEPTINEDLFEPFVNDLLNNFPRIGEVHFSTNGSHSLLGFAEALYNYTREHPKRYLRLNVQFSIDGPPSINDKNRAENATKTTWNTLKELIIYGNTHCDDWFEIFTVPKATLSQEEYTGLADNDNLYQWLKFFDEWQDEVNKINTNKHAKHMWLAQPSFSQPSDWTLNECKKLTVLYKKLSALDENLFKHYRHPILTRSLGLYSIYIGNEIHTYPLGSIGCSGGIGNFSIDYTGKLMSCHHIYDNVVMGQGIKKEFYDFTVSDTKKTDDKLLLNGYLYHDNIEFRKAQVYSLVLLMVKAGQIDKKYIEPFWFERLFLISQFEARCWCGEMAGKTSSIYLSDVGSIRLYCYGALEEIVKYYEKYRDRYYEFDTGNLISRPK